MNQNTLSVLQAFSAGSISWREACRKLWLMDMGELETALQEAGLPLPSVQTTPAVEETDAVLQRFSSFVKGNGQ